MKVIKAKAVKIKSSAIGKTKNKMGKEVLQKLVIFQANETRQERWRDSKEDAPSVQIGSSWEILSSVSTSTAKETHGIVKPCKIIKANFIV